MAKKPPILLAYDSIPTVEGIKCHLELKYDVLTAFNELDALKIAQDDNNPIDLFITDLIMPHISG